MSLSVYTLAYIECNKKDFTLFIGVSAGERYIKLLNVWCGVTVRKI